MSDSGSTLFGLNRNLLTGIGIVLIIAGIIMFLAAASSFSSFSTNPFDFAATQARMSSMFTTSAIGMILLFTGIVALRFGLVRPVTSYLASEASPAIERASAAAALGLKEGFGTNPLHSETTVKVKCRNCGYLENEDAAFCGKCGKLL
ncbi:zinc ribbon domain-containing protein [Candidatus Bathyarchaeota archaeon]|nr:zinc ribbon domain-containing protein [Candidatus Bathyarchaeota archaeon]